MQSSVFSFYSTHLPSLFKLLNQQNEHFPESIIFYPHETPSCVFKEDRSSKRAKNFYIIILILDLIIN